MRKLYWKKIEKNLTGRGAWLVARLAIKSGGLPEICADAGKPRNFFCVAVKVLVSLGQRK